MKLRRPPCVLIAPWRNRHDADATRLREAKRLAMAAGYLPLFAPHMLQDVLDDNVPEQRTEALGLSLAVLELAAAQEGSQAAVVPSWDPRCAFGHQGPASEGMQHDAGHWHRLTGRLPVALHQLPPVFNVLQGGLLDGAA